MPPLTVWEVQRKGHALSGDKDAETTVVFDKSIIMTEGNANVEIAYSQIAEVIETKSLYLFMLGKSNAVIVSKDALSEDGYNEVLSLMHENKG